MARTGTDGARDAGGGAGGDAAGDQIRLLSIPIVRALVGTYTVSAVGSAMVGVAVAFVAYQRSGSIVLTVVVLAANALPALALMPLAARLSLGRDPRSVEIGGQLAKAALSVGIATIAAGGGLSYGVLLVSNLLNGSISALSSPAWPRLARAISPEGRLADLTALFGGVAAGASIFGALAGGVLVTTLGIAWVFAANAVSYLPMTFVVRRAPTAKSRSARPRGAVRAGIRTVRDTGTLRRAFLLAGLLNLAAWPVVSTLPAIAGDIDGHAHVLGYLTGAFYAGAAFVAWAVGRLRRRYPYSWILFGGFLTAGLMLLAQAALTSWRTPGYDAVTVAVLTLVPIGLAISVAATLLQTLVQLASPNDEEGPVLAVYATAITVLTPIGGLAIGAATDALSIWWALAFSGVVITAVALVVRTRLTVFDELEQAPVPAERRPAHGYHWVVGLVAPEMLHHALAHVYHPVMPADRGPAPIA